MAPGEGEERRWARRASGRQALLWLAVLALLGVVGWLLSERNARQFTLAFEDGTLSVKRGLHLPLGKQDYHPDDPSLADAYAPLKPPPAAKLADERTFDGQAELDQALYQLLVGWARDDIAAGRSELVQRGLGYVARARKLPGLSRAQRDDLDAVLGDAAYFEARELVRRGAEALQQARQKLSEAARSSSAHARDAEDALPRVGGLADQARAAGQALAPAGNGPASGPAGAAPATAAEAPAP